MPSKSNQAPEGLVLLKSNEDRWRALLDQKSGAQGWLRTHGARVISLSRLTLEELFVALVKEEEAA
jgi:hypothetical protein